MDDNLKTAIGDLIVERDKLKEQLALAIRFVELEAQAYRVGGEPRKAEPMEAWARKVRADFFAEDGA